MDMNFKLFPLFKLFWQYVFLFLACISVIVFFNLPPKEVSVQPGQVWRHINKNPGDKTIRDVVVLDVSNGQVRWRHLCTGKINMTPIHRFTINAILIER